MDEYQFYSGKVTGEEIDEGIIYSLFTGIYIGQTPELTGTGVGHVGYVWYIPSPASPATIRRPQPNESDKPIAVWFSNPDAVVGNVTVTVTNSTGTGPRLSVSAKILGTTSITIIMARAHPIIAG